MEKNVEQTNYQDKLYIHIYLQTESEKQDENISKPEKSTREKLEENLKASHLKTLLRLTKIVNALEPRPSKRNEPNKTGYTATSCGRVGRGGNARFPTFRLDHLYGPTNQPTDGRTKPLIESLVRD